MFHFPGFASTALWIQAGIAGFSTRLGFPIRTSPDRSLVGGSPRLIAATRVLHRLLAPRHPSHALRSLQSQTSDGRDHRGPCRGAPVASSAEVELAKLLAGQRLRDFAASAGLSGPLDLNWRLRILVRPSRRRGAGFDSQSKLNSIRIRL
jgi:hypothetical protein